MRRTRETMERVRVAWDLLPDGYRTDRRLIEVHFGDWHGLTSDRTRGATIRTFRRHRRTDKWNFVPPGEGAESYAMLLDRFQPWFESLRTADRLRHPWRHMRAVFRMVDEALGRRGREPGRPAGQNSAVRNAQLEWL